MRSSLLRAAMAALSLVVLGACAHRQSPVYEESPTYSGSRVPGSHAGVVRSIDTVDARQSTSGGGAIAGGVIGAAIWRYGLQEPASEDTGPEPLGTEPVAL